MRDGPLDNANLQLSWVQIKIRALVSWKRLRLLSSSWVAILLIAIISISTYSKHRYSTVYRRGETREEVEVVVEGCL